jgi:hypothetical protein
MMLVVLYLFTVLSLTAGLLGHPPVLASMTHRAGVWALQGAAHGRHRAPVRPVPSWARKGGPR